MNNEKSGHRVTLEEMRNAQEILIRINKNKKKIGKGKDGKNY
jgi:hypothetical protein